MLDAPSLRGWSPSNPTSVTCRRPGITTGFQLVKTMWLVIQPPASPLPPTTTLVITRGSCRYVSGSNCRRCKVAPNRSMPTTVNGGKSREPMGASGTEAFTRDNRGPLPEAEPTTSRRSPSTRTRSAGNERSRSAFTTGWSRSVASTTSSSCPDNETRRSPRTVARRAAMECWTRPRFTSLSPATSTICMPWVHALPSVPCHGTSAMPSVGRYLKAFSSLLASLHDQPVPRYTFDNCLGFAASWTSNKATVARDSSTPTAMRRSLPIGSR